MDDEDFVDLVPPKYQLYQPGKWLPFDYRIHKDWLCELIKKVDENPRILHPVLQEFKLLLESKPHLYILASSMFEQVPLRKPYSDTSSGEWQVRDYHHMLDLFNHILTRAPDWNDRQYTVGLIGAPFSIVLDWPMRTISGWAFFLDPEVNGFLKRILKIWAEYLSSPPSTYVLCRDSKGWFSSHSLAELAAAANIGQTSYTFEEIFECDPSQPHFGFTTWDAFFTRRIHDDKRPVAEPDNNYVIANACESEPYKVARNIAKRDRFWLKGQPYSVMDMLDMDPLHERYVGGTIYQGYLSALSYHRWHAPISGRVVKAYVKDGQYFSEPLFFEMNQDPNNLSPSPNDMGGDDDEEEEASVDQVYTSATATRAIIYFEADNKDLGLVCFLGIGMGEISSCDITVKVGQHVNKGDEIGMFHYGGSTHCLLFEKGVEVYGFPDTESPEYNFPVRSKLAVLQKKTVVGEGEWADDFLL